MAQGLPEVGENEYLLPSKGVRIKPSDVNIWQGVRKEDQRYTMGQLARMREKGIDPDTVEDVVVRRKVSHDEMWWPTFSPTPTFLMPCPILERRGDGSQCHVISPYGATAWVYSDGSITKGRQIGFGPNRKNFAGPRR